MRLLHLADLHLGFRQYQRVTPGGINQREADVAAAFRSAIDIAIERKPDVIVIAGDVFHNVRPTNPAILHSFQQFARLTAALPDTPVVMITGNHDTPRSAETGIILRLFSQLGMYVVDGAPQRIQLAEKDLSILAVPAGSDADMVFEPDPSAKWNVLLLHAAIGPDTGIATYAEHSLEHIPLERLNRELWSYVALGHHHVFDRLAHNVFYPGAIEYTSAPWYEMSLEHDRKVKGKGIVEWTFEDAKHEFIPLKRARDIIDLEPINARGMTAADLDTAIRARVDGFKSGIDDKIVRLVVNDVPRHIARELDHKQLREYKKRALHFHLDTRRPELMRVSASGAAGKRPSLADIVRDKLRARLIESDIDRDQLVELGLRYLRDAETLEIPAAAAASDER